MDDGFLEILHFLEERPIFPRLPFMIIKSIGHERQSAIKGFFVNVPIRDDPPTSFQWGWGLQLHLKRRMEYGHDFMAETILLSKIADAIRYFVDSELHRKQNCQ